MIDNPEYRLIQILKEIYDCPENSITNKKRSQEALDLLNYNEDKTCKMCDGTKKVLIHRKGCSDDRSSGYCSLCFSIEEDCSVCFNLGIKRIEYWKKVLIPPTHDCTYPETPCQICNENEQLNDIFDMAIKFLKIKNG